MDHRNYQLSWLCSLILLLDSSSLLAPLLVSHFVTKVALKVEDPNGAGFNSKREVDTGNHKEQKNWKPGQTKTWCTSKQRLTNMDWTTWVYTVYTVEVCTGSKLKPEPARTRDRLTWPDPTRAAQLNLEPEPDPKSPPPPAPQRITKKKGKGCISRLHAKKRINQGSAISQTFTSYESLWTSGAAVAYILPSLWILYGQEDDDRANYGHFLSVKAR